MKQFIISLIILTLLITLTVCHSAVMHRFGEEAEKLCGKIAESAEKKEWQTAERELDELKALWEKKRSLAAITVPTTIIEEIDTSIEKAATYAKLKQQPDFSGEFILLKNLIKHLPKREGLSPEEVF